MPKGYENPTMRAERIAEVTADFFYWRLQAALNCHSQIEQYKETIDINDLPGIKKLSFSDCHLVDLVAAVLVNHITQRDISPYEVTAKSVHDTNGYPIRQFVIVATHRPQEQDHPS